LQREAEGLRPRKLSDGPDLMQLAADDLQGPRDPLLLPRGDGSLDFEVGLAVALAEVPRGAPPARALEAVRLLMVSVQAVWRDMEQRERAAGLGMVQSRVASHFSPVAATPDELGDAWSQGRVALSLQTSWNGRHVGLCDVAEAMTLHFGQLASQLAQTRRVRPATLLGTGPISAGGQMHDGERQWPKGWHSIAEKRAMETVQSGSPVTGYLKAGDQVQVDMKGRDGRSMLGAIELSVADADES
jgi:fumarylacetoacetate (FAA) hydrolase